MLLRILVGAFLAATILVTPSLGAITPEQVVVVFNASTAQDGYDWSVSKQVADYYCGARGIPSSNKIGVVWPFADEWMRPDQFFRYIIDDQGSDPGLKSFLSSRSGFSEGNPGTDPTKCIVLCTGIPVLISGDGITCSVDSSLSLLFNKTEWGHLPVTGYPAAGAPYFFANPYCEKHSDATKDVDPAQRTIPADFGEFRANPANRTPETAPNFTIARIMDSTPDATLALAGGNHGLLYRGVRSSGKWIWKPIADEAKAYLIHDVTDISVLDPQTAAVISRCGGVIRTINGGIDWQLARSPETDYSLPDTLPSVSFGDTSHGWAVGK